MKYCSYCGHANANEARYCGGCGKEMVNVNQNPQEGAGRTSEISFSFVDKLNDYVGNDKPADLNWKILFIDVLTKSGGETTVGIDYNGYIWTVNHVLDWVNMEEDDFNNKISIEIGKNVTGNNREGTIVIQSEKLLAQVAIVQAGVATQMSLSQYSLHFSK